jgi:riboflavin synthase
MFTGLVTDVGRITHVADSAAGRELRIDTAYDTLQDGESIAVNGACLTVRSHGSHASGASWFTCAAVVTTLDRTTFASWREGRNVNLERALQVGDRLGGHIVLGHVDGVGEVIATAQKDDAFLIDVELPAHLLPLMVAQGSVTIDGVSLTINALLPHGVQLSIIEYTKRHTTLGELVAGDLVHVEADVLAKHVERLLAPRLASLQGTT